MAAHASLPVPTQADTTVLGQAAQSTNSTYKILYFGLHGRGELTRTLLAYSGAKWEELPVDWPTQKEHTPFKCLPVVYETAQDGTILELAESQAIERYLANKYGLYGKNAYEAHKVEQIFSSADGVAQAFSQKIIGVAQDKRVEEANKLYVEVLPKFIAIHEAQLAKNGSNGHYIGNSATLADIKVANLIDRLLFLRPQGANEVPFSAEKTPNLWKVLEKVNSHPTMAAWKKSDRYQELNAGTKSMFKF
ncbi:hypothetical protein BGZ96_003923 [Linnemannia gamsii]|uniref:glutathione transferase n=1 Tax=Linnemannia gamsii TaxID=64522 RepID=A0ABQ7KG62_9FUNG|nr:hypothetical protein BGZ96_003923 [Linnemannia gamsii]